ncbi:MAG: redoxin domain-containing protein, partial [Planctomycetaceae bacterium]|nr:redoxin domain-containing protein [Planctomycetaceae bacterium]
TYTVIAECERPDGFLTGRVETEAPDTNVRIALQRRGGEIDDSRSTVRPARPVVAPVSNVDESGEAEDDRQAAPRTNREDVESVAPEAESLRKPQRRTAPTLSIDADETDWATGSAQNPASSKSSSTGQAGSARKRPADPEPRTNSLSPRLEVEDDERNPLPPALDPEKVGASDDDAADEQVKLATTPRRPTTWVHKPANAWDVATNRESGPDDAATSPAQDPPRPLAREGAGHTWKSSTDSHQPVAIGEPDVSSPVPEKTPETDQTDGRDLSAELAPTSVPFASTKARAKASDAKPRPTWGELVFQKPSIPLDESLLKASREQAPKGAPAPRTTLPAGSKPDATQVIARGEQKPQRSSQALTRPGVWCEFNPLERRLIDFQLPDAQGRMVAFHDIDTDLVLLDFWGTWCAPCRKSIPHLNEIQQMLGGKRMQVIGIACERTASKDRPAKVRAAINQLKITYPVLISGMDGTCPVQDAFGIQFYPTMVLLDRQGRILWREQGATDVTLARMDRFIAKNLNLPAPNAELAVGPRRARSKN